MRGGRFRHIAIFEAQSDGGLDQFRNPLAPAWAEVFQAPASLKAQPGREALASGRHEAAVRGTLRVQASAQSPAHDLGPAHRVRIGGQLWSVLSHGADVDGQGRELEFLVEREVAL